MSVKQSPHEEYDRGFSNGWDACADRAQPAQAGQVLTDEEIRKIGSLAMDSPYFGIGFDFARAIEQAVLAKRVPMTVAQITHALRSEPMADNEESFALGIRHAERHHGIVGKEGA